MPTRLEELCAEPLEFEVPGAPPEPSIGGAPPSPQRPEFSENELLIRWALARLDCPANFGWSVVDEDEDELLCRCGGGSHHLNMTSVTNILAPLGYSKDVFRSHVDRTRSKYVQRNMIELVNGFLQEHAGQKPENLEEVASQVGAAIEAEEMFTKTTSEKFCLHVEQEKAEKGDKRYQSELQKYRGLQEQYEGKMEMERRRLKAEWEQACKYRKQVEATRKDIQAKMDDMREHQRRLTHRQQEICEAFPKAVEKGWEEAFVDHVLSLAELVTGFPRQERRSVEEADDAIQAARGVNEEHRQAWENWRTRWSDVPEVLKTVAQAEPKVSAEEKARMEESVRSAASALRADFATKISAVVPERRAFFEAKLEEVTRQWKEVGGR
ncbi:unnamed protein product [Symbiodinium sp. CCMP2456]|nr:unnamed protein product [Symbiodinium sp. CCMP2456]